MAFGSFVTEKGKGQQTLTDREDKDGVVSVAISIGVEEERRISVEIHPIQLLHQILSALTSE